MNITLERTWILLVAATIGSGLLAGSFPEAKGLVVGIMFLAGSKFLLVAFQFMDIKKANSIWKTLLVFYAGLLVLLSLVV